MPPEWVRDDAGQPLKATDALLEKIHDLRSKRDATLRQIELWREAEPMLGEILNDLELHLR